MEDKRQYMRFNADGEVLIMIEGQPPQRVSCNLVDICFKGLGCMMQLALDQKFAQDVPVRLELTTGLWEGAISGQGVIKYVTTVKRRGQEAFRVGIEFRDIDTKVIQNVINRIQQDICMKARRTG